MKRYNLEIKNEQKESFLFPDTDSEEKIGCSSIHALFINNIIITASFVEFNSKRGCCCSCSTITGRSSGGATTSSILLDSPNQPSLQ